MKTVFEAIQTNALGSMRAPEAAIMSAVKPVKAIKGPFGRPLEFLGNRFVYAVISQRSHGLSIGINLNPDKCCNFDCAYCEVNREVPGRDSRVDVDVLAAELENL